MDNISNIYVAIISSCAALFSAILTGLIIFLIERYKFARLTNEMRRSTLLLLSAETTFTVYALERWLINLAAFSERKLVAEDYINIYQQLLFSLQGATGAAISEVIHNYRCLPMPVQVFFSVYYRQMEALRLVSTYAVGVYKNYIVSIEALSLTLDKLCEYLKCCHILLALIATENKNDEEKKKHEERAKLIEKAHVLIKEKLTSLE